METLILVFNINDPNTIDGDYIFTNYGDGTCGIVQYTGDEVKLTIPNIIGGLRVTRIEEEAFAFGYQEEIILPDTVEYIGDWAFYWNELKTIKLSVSLKEIGYAAFAKNDFEKIILPVNLEVLGDFLFADCDYLSSVYTFSNIEYIGDDVFYNHIESLIVYGELNSQINTYCDNNSITFYGYTDSYGDGVMGRTYTRPDDSIYSVTYYDGSSAADPKIQADYYDDVGVMFFTEQFGDDGTIVASIWFHEGTIIPSVKNYYDDGTLYFQEEYNTSNILIASVSYHADGVSRYFKNYYDNGLMYFQEEYDTDGEMIASIWFQEDGVTRNFKNYYDGYLYFREEYNTEGIMIASINFRSNFTRERKCYYRVSDGSLYLIEYYDENEVFIDSEWF